MGVAEAWGMETLVSAAVDLGERDCVLLVLGDNKGVLYGWQKGRSASAEVNETFLRMSTVATSAGVEVSASYIASAKNPADTVSRGDVSGYLPFPFPVQEP
ncbi:unnamed protein product [Tilletia laevis]|uniref:Uncharacterized protein n=2 Tax=Tilletia TaxID=13289 RepID=A0A9N8M608_9BASI|nr:hypothetical protein CF336_g7338 [Tilletia laevis]CAD6950136.1 unnamed protein product [Tilletia caries]CAD6968799.1 unnamed protein product [Tilletia controversa]KAE8187585.1 hypothetical protein CF335_g7130 [Tilletia laevis]CAD6933811.1 unnamed protein product [Tilletia laevis]